MSWSRNTGLEKKHVEVAKVQSWTKNNDTILNERCCENIVLALVCLQITQHTNTQKTFFGFLLFEYLNKCVIIIMGHKGINVCLSVILSLLCDIYSDTDHNDVTKCISLEMLENKHIQYRCTRVENIMMCLIITYYMMKVSKYI